jgi:hypothetical protein
VVERWFMKGVSVGACNCDWGCPCNFDAPPTRGFCEGGDMFVVREGRYGEVSLDGLAFAWFVHSPGALHEGNVTTLYLVDELATPAQRAALEALTAGDGAGSPWDILAAITGTRLPTIYAPIEVKLDGIRSEVRIAGGEILEVAVTRIKNPVTGEEEVLYLDKPTGFLSVRSELGMSTTLRLRADGLAYDHSGKYAEYAEFEYAGP